MARGIVRFNPFAELDAWEKKLFEGGFPSIWRGVKMPITDVYTEGDGMLTVEAHLPGFSPDDVEVSVDDGALVIQAERHEKTEDDKKKTYVMRESTSSYYRRIALPEKADEGAIAADFSEGVLKVTVPFRELPEPRKIAVTTGESSPPAAIETS